MNPRLRFPLTVVFLAASILACNLGKPASPPAVITNTPVPTGSATPVITNTPLPTGSPTPDIETVDEFFARCPSAAEVAQVDADLKVSFEYDPTAGTLVCSAAAGSVDLTALQKRAYQTIYVTRLLHFSQPLPWTDKQLYDWLVGAIDGIRFVDGGGSGLSFCCDPENTIVVALNPNSVILTTDQWLMTEVQNGLMFSMVLYIHEARHNEGYGHTCPDNSGNDTLLNEMSSWSVQYYLLLWIAQYGERAFLKAPGGDPNIYRKISLDEAQWTRGIRFCQDPAPTPGPTLMIP